MATPASSSPWITPITSTRRPPGVPDCSATIGRPPAETPSSIRSALRSSSPTVASTATAEVVVEVLVEVVVLLLVEVVVEVVVVVVVVDELVVVAALVLVSALVLIEGASASPIAVAGAPKSPVVAASDPQAPASNASATENTATAGVRSGVGRCTVRRYRCVRNVAEQQLWDFGPMAGIPGISDERVGAVIAFVREQQATDPAG